MSFSGSRMTISPIIIKESQKNPYFPVLPWLKQATTSHVSTVSGCFTGCGLIGMDKGNGRKVCAPPTFSDFATPKTLKIIPIFLNSLYSTEIYSLSLNTSLRACFGGCLSCVEDFVKRLACKIMR